VYEERKGFETVLTRAQNHFTLIRARLQNIPTRVWKGRVDQREKEWVMGWSLNNLFRKLKV
jgi:hypothetical protein